MRGHEPLIAMRLSGSVPDCVWIDTDPDQLQRWRDWDKRKNSHAQIQIEDGDTRPDMRCVTGLKCYIFGTTARRVFAVRDACIAVGAKRVIAAVHTPIGIGEFQTFRLDHMSDTERTHELAGGGNV